jgi:hypothetical protein
MRRWRLLFHCIVIAALMNVVENGFSQAQTTERTGCLVPGTRAGTFELVDEVTGQRILVTGSDLGRYTASGGTRVTLTGTVTKQDNTETFQAASVRELQAACGPVGFSADSLKQSIGRARFGVRAGGSLDPELLNVGLQAQLGPIFKGTWFRPTAEYAFGEVTHIFSINADVAYYLPFTGVGTNQRNRWNTYIGGGPAFTILQRDFEGFPEQPSETKTDWDTEFGLNFMFGVIQSSGMFVELRASAYKTPTVGLFIGYVFH